MKGISFEKSRGKWRVRATVDGKRTLIGRYDTEKEAEAALMSYQTITAVMQYEEHDEGIKWLKPFRDAKLKLQERARKRLLQNAAEAENDRKLEAL